MTYDEEQELLRLCRENNVMLRALIRYLKGDNVSDFMANIMANLVANKMENKY